MTFAVIGTLTLYLIETYFNVFANRADPEFYPQNCLGKYNISDPKLSGPNK